MYIIMYSTKLGKENENPYDKHWKHCVSVKYETWIYLLDTCNKSVTQKKTYGCCEKQILEEIKVGVLRTTGKILKSKNFNLKMCRKKKRNVLLKW
jgi:hypothetical protein